MTQQKCQEFPTFKRLGAPPQSVSCLSSAVSPPESPLTLETQLAVEEGEGEGELDRQEGWRLPIRMGEMVRQEEGWKLTGRRRGWRLTTRSVVFETGLTAEHF